MIKLQPKNKDIVTMPNTLVGVKLPEWGSVNEFCRWWVDAGCPIAPPGQEVYLSDDATSFALFRSGQFQVELYLIHPNPNLPIHQHPDVEVIKMQVDSFSVLDGVVKRNTCNPASDALLQGQSHGAGANFKERKSTAGFATSGHPGFGLLAFQKWKDGLTPTTVAARWKGKTVGPKQEALIRRLTPGAYVEDGYADTTGAP